MRNIEENEADSDQDLVPSEEMQERVTAKNEEFGADKGDATPASTPETVPSSEGKPAHIRHPNSTYKNGDQPPAAEQRRANTGQGDAEPEQGDGI